MAHSFQGAGICSVSSFLDASFDDFVNRLGESFLEYFRGKNPPGW
jgi:hypothetical protein